MEVPPGPGFSVDSTQIINLLEQLPQTEEGFKMTELLLSKYINQTNKKHETPNTTRKRVSNQMDKKRKQTKESAKKPKKYQLNKTENSKNKSTNECIFEERKCYICEIIFNKASTFVNHLRKYNNLCCMVKLVEEGEFDIFLQCALCVKTFKSKGYAARHVNDSHKAIKEICDSDTFIPKKQTPIDTNNPQSIAESSNATAIQPTGQTLVTNNQNDGNEISSSWGFCFRCRMRVPFVDYKAHMASNNNENVPGEGERSTNTHTAAHMNNQGNVKEEVSIERNVQEAAKKTKFNRKTYRINPLSRCPPMNIHDNDMEKEYIKRNDAQRINVSHNVRSMSETTVVPGHNSQPCTTSELEIMKGAEEEYFATNSNNSKVNTGYNNNYDNEMVRASKENSPKETVEEERVNNTKTLVTNEVIDITCSDDEEATREPNDTPSSSAEYRQDRRRTENDCCPAWCNKFFPSGGH